MLQKQGKLDSYATIFLFIFVFALHVGVGV